MKSLLLLAAVASLAVNSVSGHYIFQQFSAGSTKYPVWQYIRPNTNPSWEQNAPVTDLTSKDLRCNVGGQVSNGTKTIAMKAGDQFTFTLDTAVYHQGPISLYVEPSLVVPSNRSVDILINNQVHVKGPWRGGRL